jgi:D-apionolactonase
VIVRAGSLRLELEGADVRYVRFGGLELVRRIYAAVRDDAWGTVPYRRRLIELERRPDRFRARFGCTARDGAIELDWTIDVEGTPAGGLHFRMDGEAGSAFAYNRIGICVLHPPAVTAGQRYRATRSEGRMPLRIGPQPVENEIAVALFEPFRELELDLPPGGLVRFEFSGDEFEMEDQRNWTDASFKTYSTPLARGLPHRASPGQRFEQAVQVSFAPPPGPRRARPRALAVTLGEVTAGRLPAVGLGLPRPFVSPGAPEMARLAALRPSHLRCDLDVGTGFEALSLASAAASDSGALLELALAVGDDAEAELAAFARAAAGHREQIARVLVLPRDLTATTSAQAAAAREHLGSALPGVTLVSGTAGDFVELNRGRGALGLLDAIAYSIDPQAHAFDDRSLIETLDAQAETVVSAQALSGGLPVVVGPVTLGPRRAAGVDQRQALPFGAAWTVGSLHRLSAAASITYYEATGPRGVTRSDQIGAVLSTLAEWRGARIVAAETSDPLALEVLAVEHAGSVSMLLASLHPRARRVRVASGAMIDLPAFATARVDDVR